MNFYQELSQKKTGPRVFATAKKLQYGAMLGKSLQKLQHAQQSELFPSVRGFEHNWPVGFVNSPLSLYRFVPLVKDTTGRLRHMLAASVPP